MTPTLALTAALLAGPMTAHATDTTPDTVEVEQQCDAMGYRYYAHRVAAGEMAADVWPTLTDAGWVVTFAGPTSPVLVSPACYTVDPYATV